MHRRANALFISPFETPLGPRPRGPQDEVNFDIQPLMLRANEARVSACQGAALSLLSPAALLLKANSVSVLEGEGATLFPSSPASLILRANEESVSKGEGRYDD